MEMLNAVFLSGPFAILERAMEMAQTRNYYVHGYPGQRSLFLPPLKKAVRGQEQKKI